MLFKEEVVKAIEEINPKMVLNLMLIILKRTLKIALNI